MARFIIDTLTDLGMNKPTPLPALVRHASSRDRALAAVVFFNPESAPEVTDDQGRLVWERVRPGHYRSTTFYQYKSVLKHAGVLAPHALGGASARDYSPEDDIWELVS